MKKVADAAALQRLAAALGGEVSIDRGSRAPVRRGPEPAPRPEPAPAPDRGDRVVDALVASARAQVEVAHAQAQVFAQVLARLPPPPTPPAPRRMPVAFALVRDVSDRVVDIVPEYADVGDKQFQGLDMTMRKDGLIDTINPSYH